MQPKPHNYVKSGFFSFFEKFSALVFGFGSLILLLKLLSKEDFGTWALFLTIASFIEVGRIGILQNALVKYLSSAEPEEYPKITTASLVINVGLTAVLAVGLYFLAYPLSELWKAPALIPMLHLYVINNIVLIPFYQFSFIQQGNLDFTGIFWSSFFKQGVFFVYVLICFFTKIPTDLLQLSYIQIVSSVVSVLVGFVLARKYLRFSRVIDGQWVSTLFAFGKFVFGTNIASMLFKSVDKMLLGATLSSGAVAVYELAIRVTNLVEVPTFSLAAVMYPHSSKKAAEEGIAGIRQIYEKTVGLIMTVVLPFVVFNLLFPKVIIWIIGGTRYFDTAPILRITILFGLFIPYLIQFGTVLDAIGRPKLNFYFTVFTALISLIINYFFVKTWGIMGAALGTLAAYALVTTLGLVYLHRLLGVQPLHVFQYTKQYYQQGYAFIKDKIHTYQNTSL